MKVAILIDAEDSFTEKYLAALQISLENHNLTIYYITPPKVSNPECTILHESQYLFKSANSRMYSQFFSEIMSLEYDKVIVTRLRFPEYFLLEIIARKIGKLNFTIAFYGWNEITNFASREFLINEFLYSNPDNKILLHTNAWWNTQDIKHSFPIENLQRIKVLSDPIYDDPHLFGDQDQLKAKTKLGIPQDSKVLLFFGSMFFGKGPDILIEAFQKLPEDYWLLLAGDISSVNFAFSPESMSNKRVIKFTHFIPEELVPTIFTAADLVCLPYRNSYRNGTSGVLVQSALANRKILVPNFSPFSDVVSKYEIGTTFDSENIDSLINSIIEAFQIEKTESNWNHYLSSMSTWEEISQAYIS